MSEEADDSDYNILTLYLIMEKMKGKKSKFYEYIQVVEESGCETLIDWRDEDIRTIKDGMLRDVSFVQSVRKQFNPIYRIF